MAPSVRRTLNEDQIVDLEGSLNIGVPLKSLYLVELKQSGRVPMKSVKTAWPVEDQNDVMIVGEIVNIKFIVQK